MSIGTEQRRQRRIQVRRGIARARTGYDAGPAHLTKRKAFNPKPADMWGQRIERRSR